MFDFFKKKKEFVVSEEIKKDIQRHLDSRYIEPYQNVYIGKHGTVSFASETPEFLKSKSTGTNKVQFMRLPDESDNNEEPKPSEKTEESSSEDDKTGTTTKKYDLSGPNIQFQMWYDPEEENQLNALRNTSLSKSEVKALDLMLDKKKEKTFSETLLEMISQQDCRDSVIYKRAQVDRRLFSKIAGDKNYKPAKDTVLAFAFALGCDLDGANRLLERTGYLFSTSSKRDMILEACFILKIHDLTYVNAILAQFDQKIIGRENVG